MNQNSHNLLKKLYSLTPFEYTYKNSLLELKECSPAYKLDIFSMWECHRWPSSLLTVSL